jgi:hypothetical protein
MSRNANSERAAVDALAGRIKATKEQAGRQITGEEARRQAQRIAERSDAERREGTRK